MRLPNLLYNFAQLKDITGGLNLLVTREVTLTDTSTLLEISLIEIPADKVLILTTMAAIGLPGAGQAVTTIQFFTNQMAPPSIEFSWSSGDAVNNWSGEIWVAPGDQVGAICQFDAGANANTVTCGIHGFMVPRANVQQG